MSWFTERMEKRKAQLAKERPESWVGKTFVGERKLTQYSDFWHADVVVGYRPLQGVVEAVAKKTIKINGRWEQFDLLVMHEIVEEPATLSPSPAPNS